MQKEEQIIGMLEKIMGELDEHGRKLDEHNEKLDLHSSALGEHGQILTALRSGQEHLKAEIDGMKVSNAKAFGGIEKQISEFEGNTEILRDEIWHNKKDIHRIKNTMGMN